MSNQPHIKTDLDMDSLFDFSGSGNSPQASGSQPGPASRNSYNDALSPFDQSDERQVFAGPSHEYDRFKQQTGLPVGTVASLANLNQPMPASFGPSQMYNGFNSGIEDMGFNSGFDASWSTGIDMDGDMGMDFHAGQAAGQAVPTMFFPPGQSQSDDFIDPTSLGGQDEPPSNVGRLWPGMHSQQAQQAAMAKAHAQAQQQQRQQAMQQQKHLAPPQKQLPRSRASSYQTDPHTEESISRLLNQMRQNSAASTGSGEDANGNSVLPQIARMRKEEEDMDEDERLLASEEGKKLSSKERRQLRNKVSARAFRSRRKEYIGQLEGEVAMKTQEAQNLRTENRSLMEENARYRGLIQTLLRHPAFQPFINDLSRDPNVVAPTAQHPVQMAPTPAPQQPRQPQQEDVKPFPDFDASQLQIPNQQEQHVGMAMIPEAPVDLSMLNINNNGFSMPSNANYNFQRPQVFGLFEVPQGPTPLELALDVMSGKKSSPTSVEKPEYPVVESMPSAAATAVADVEPVDLDEKEFPLYASSAMSTSAPSYTVSPLQSVSSPASDLDLNSICERMETRANGA